MSFVSLSLFRPARRRWFGAAALVTAASVLSSDAACGGALACQEASRFEVRIPQIEVGEIRVRYEGIEESEARQLAAIAQVMLDELSSEAQLDIFAGRRDLRIRVRPGQAPNYYCGGTAATTLVVPKVEVAAEIQSAYRFLDTVAESCWSRIVRPVWGMPRAMREAINRTLAQHCMPKIVERLGEDWWFGKAVPQVVAADHEAWSLPADSATLQQRGSCQALLARLVAKQGVKRLLSRLSHWNVIRLNGSMAAVDLQKLVTEVVFDDDIEASETLLQPISFATREPWSGPDIRRLKGIHSEVGRGSLVVRLWYGKNQTLPEHHVSVRGGAPTVVARVPSSGNWSFRNLEVVLRRKGEFRPDQRFFVVLLNQDGHETFRWAYSVDQIPLESGWLVLGNMPEPDISKDFFVALEFGEMGEGQDVEIGVWKGSEAEHCFRSDPGRRIAAVAQALDFSCVISLGGAGLIPRQLPRILQQSYKQPR